MGDPIEPVGQQFSGRDDGGLPGEDEEGGLKSILGIVVMTEHTTAHAPDQRAMPIHEGCERRFVTAGGEPTQQFHVSAGSTFSGHYRPANVLDDLLHAPRRHAVPLELQPSPTIYYFRQKARLIHVLFYWLNELATLSLRGGLIA
jgi:hypothetical protein